MESKVEEIYIEFDKRRKAFEAAEEDRKDETELKMLEEVEKAIKAKK